MKMPSNNNNPKTVCFDKGEQISLYKNTFCTHYITSLNGGIQKSKFKFRFTHFSTVTGSDVIMKKYTNT